MEPLLLTIKKAGEVLGLSIWQVRGLCDAAALPFTKVGNRTYIPAESVREYAESIRRSA